MLISVVVLILVTIISSAIAISYLIQGPPYVPIDDEGANQMVSLTKDIKSKYILDMGSGNGKLVILLARQGYKVDGIELNPLLVLRSRRAINKAGLQDNASIIWGNFWKHDVSKYDTVVLYVIKHIMPKLELKLLSELKPGTHVISNYFVFPKIKPYKTYSRARAYKF